MVDSPAFQFYAAEYLADANVQAMSLAQEGIYVRLLAYCWREGSLPNDDKILSRLCKGCSANSLIEVKQRFALNPNGRLVHIRLETERIKQSDFREKQKENGKKGGRPRLSEQRKRAKASVGVYQLTENPSLSSGINQTETKESSSSSSSVNTPLTPLEGGDTDRETALNYWRGVRGGKLYENTCPRWAKEIIESEFSP